MNFTAVFELDGAAKAKELYEKKEEFSKAKDDQKGKAMAYLILQKIFIEKKVKVKWSQKGKYDLKIKDFTKLKDEFRDLKINVKIARVAPHSDSKKNNKLHTPRFSVTHWKPEQEELLFVFFLPEKTVGHDEFQSDLNNAIVSKFENENLITEEGANVKRVRLDTIECSMENYLKHCEIFILGATVSECENLYKKKEYKGTTACQVPFVMEDKRGSSRFSRENRIFGLIVGPVLFEKNFKKLFLSETAKLMDFYSTVDDDWRAKKKSEVHLMALESSLKGHVKTFGYKKVYETLLPMRDMTAKEPLLKKSKLKKKTS